MPTSCCWLFPHTAAWAILTDMAEIAKPRWYHLRPDRPILALLVVEGFLLLSEWFHWFSFNDHKGWTLLIVVEIVGETMLLMLLWFVAALIFRLRFQFSIRSLLVLAVVVSIACSWFATENKGQGSRTGSGGD